MSEKKLLNEGVVNFFFKKEICRSLSNFWECKVIIIDGDELRKYESGENCFHGEKFIRIGNLCGEAKRRQDLLNYGIRFLKSGDFKIGHVVKKMGRKFILSKDELELWSRLSIPVQVDICKYKFDNYEEVRRDLLESKGKLLVHPAMRCNEEKVKTRLWEGKGIVVEGKIEIIGKNMLGNLWMKCREELG